MAVIVESSLSFWLQVATFGLSFLLIPLFGSLGRLRSDIHRLELLMANDYVKLEKYEHDIATLHSRISNIRDRAGVRERE